MFANSTKTSTTNPPLPDGHLRRFLLVNKPAILPTLSAQPVSPATIPYRILYLAIAWLITASLLHQYSYLLLPLIPPTSFGREFLICGGQIFWQLAMLAFFPGARVWDYLGSLMTISLAGGLALGVILTVVPASAGPYLFGALFACVAGVMFLEHIHRTRILAISSWLTVSWVMYRVVLLGIVLI